MPVTRLRRKIISSAKGDRKKSRKLRKKTKKSHGKLEIESESRGNAAPASASSEHRPLAPVTETATSRDKVEESGYQSFIFDMDGVIQRFGTPIEGGAAMLKSLLDTDTPFIILTNEDRYTNAKLLTKLHGMLEGVQLRDQHLFTASNSVKLFFVRMLSRGWRGSVYAIGEEGLLENLKEAFSKYEDCSVLTLQEPEIPTMKKVEFVVVGSIYSNTPAGSEYVSSLERACGYASSGAKVVCSCPDDFEVNAAGEVKLGSPGPTVDVLEKVTGVGSYPLGKPNPHMLQAARDQLREHYRDRSCSEHVLFVGDSLGTDIRTALEHGIDCALVLTGTTSREKLKTSPLEPTFIFDGISDIHRCFLEGSLRRSCIQP